MSTRDPPCSAVVVRGRSYFGVAFSADHAENLFREIGAVEGVYCVAPPRSLFVTSAAAARAFFDEVEQR